MANEDLKNGPETHAEHTPHSCPACERPFEGLTDYPKVFIAEATVSTVDDIPNEIPHWWKEDLLEEPTEGWRREFVPPEVIKFFTENPDNDSLTYTDKYIYHRPFNQTAEYRANVAAHPERFSNEDNNADVMLSRYHRQYNYSDDLKRLFSSNTALNEYLALLQQRTGQEIVTRDLLPQWSTDSEGVFPIPEDTDQPDSPYEHFVLFIAERDSDSEKRIADIVVAAPEGNGRHGTRNIGVFTAASISYEGRINQ